MNYYKGSRIGTQILKFLGSQHVSGGTQRGVHGHMVAIAYMERKSTVGNIAT